MRRVLIANWALLRRKYVPFFAVFRKNVGYKGFAASGTMGGRFATVSMQQSRTKGSEAVISVSMEQTSVFQFEIEEAIERYADMVYRLAVLNTGSRFEADDIFQEVFLKLFRYRESIQSEEHLKAWLIRVTVNQCKTAATSAWSKRKVSLDVVAELAEESAEQEYPEVYEAVRTLPEKYRQVIHLFYYEELSVKEISRILGRNEATIKTHLARGRKLLADRLGGGVTL